MPLLIVFLGVAVLIFLISYLKINTFISLLLVSIACGLFLGIPISKIVTVVEAGMGSTLGHIGIIFGVGAMMGRLLADAGGAQRIAMTLIKKFGRKKIEWAVIISSFLVGLAMFFEVGLVLLLPIIFSIAKELKMKPMNLAIPMLASLLVTHGFLPPHPGPTVVATGYHASLGLVLIYGIIVAIPTVIISGIFFNKVDKKIIPSAFNKDGNEAMLGTQKEMPLEETPSFGVSTFTAIFPVILLMGASIVEITQEMTHFKTGGWYKIVQFIGNGDIAMILSLLVALYTMGIQRKIPIKKIAASCSTAAAAIGMMLLIIGGGGAFKQVLVEGGVGKYIASLFSGGSVSPIIMSYIIAFILRLALGSSTVAGISTVGLVLPLIGSASPSMLALVTLATGAGSATFSNVDDASFWIIKSYFNLNMKETFLTWSLMCTVLSAVGLVMILLISIFVH